MPIIQTGDLTPGRVADPFANHQIYNGLDGCVTFEVQEELQTLLGNQPNVIYDFERALQAPALEMMLRGFCIDETERRIAVADLQGKIGQLEWQLNELAQAVWGQGLNPRSPQQLKDFFYRAMQIPEQWKSVKGIKKLSTDRETLEKLEVYFYARPIIATILAIRDLTKQLEVFTTEIDPDGRLRTSYNIAGTETGRWSSSASSEGTGRNVQNIDRALRRVFIADPGYKLGGIDLEQAESREVGWQCGILFDDWSYLDACYEGDLHTITCRMCWRDLPWTGDLKKDRALADQIFYRTFSYRDMSKRLGHGTNYYGTPWTMARHAKIPVKWVEDFQDGYFAGFPGIAKWHQHVAATIQTSFTLVTPWGRERQFFGRTYDDTTLREAIAFVPQSATADRMNLGLWRVWKTMGTRVQLLAQVHDAVYFQFPEEADEVAIMEEALHLIDIRTTAKGHTLIVPGEPKTGWNWGDFNDDPKKGRVNPMGMKKLKGPDTRTRLTGLNRVL